VLNAWNARLIFAKSRSAVNVADLRETSWSSTQSAIIVIRGRNRGSFHSVSKECNVARNSVEFVHLIRKISLLISLTQRFREFRFISNARGFCFGWCWSLDRPSSKNECLVAGEVQWVLGVYKMPGAWSARRMRSQLSDFASRGRSSWDFIVRRWVESRLERSTSTSVCTDNAK